MHEIARQGGAKAVLLIDGDPAMLVELGRLLRRAGYSVTEAETGEAGIEAARSEPPDIVLLGVALPDGSGFEIYRELTDAFGQSLPVVFLSAGQPVPGDEVAALLLGAADYVTRPVVPDVLLARVRRLADPGDPEPSSPAPGLTHREMQVLKLLVRGFREGEIARDLYIAPKTVAKHIEHILGKLGVHSRAQAVAQAVRWGMVPEQEQPGLVGEAE
jgi:DNA-binding NarL/FixJ family response regulator